MDAAFALTGLIEEVTALMTEGDFEGAEDLLTNAILAYPQYEAFFHFQLGKVYSRWNKLTSSLNHLHKAAELARMRGDEIFTIQVVAELSAVRDRQASQKP